MALVKSLGKICGGDEVAAVASGTGDEGGLRKRKTPTGTTSEITLNSPSFGSGFFCFEILN
jgi:hypothetical protein